MLCWVSKGEPKRWFIGSNLQPSELQPSHWFVSFSWSDGSGPDPETYPNPAYPKLSDHGWIDSRYISKISFLSCHFRRLYDISVLMRLLGIYPEAEMAPTAWLSSLLGICTLYMPSKFRDKWWLVADMWRVVNSGTLNWNSRESWSLKIHVPKCVSLRVKMCRFQAFKHMCVCVVV
jgi:hypothetical protein